MPGTMVWPPRLSEHGSGNSRFRHSALKEEIVMKRVLTTAALAAALGLALPAAAQQPPKTPPTAKPNCAADWRMADKNNDGALTGAELDKFKAVMPAIDTNKDGKISSAEFLAACDKGLLKDIKL